MGSQELHDLINYSFFSEVTMNVSSEIAWGIIRDNSSFLLKKRGKSHQTFEKSDASDFFFTYDVATLA